MKVKFNRAALQEALGLVTSIVPARTPKPILKCLHLSAEKDCVFLCATDLEAGINYKISQVEVEKTGQIVIPADRFTAIIRESVDEVLSLEADEQICKITGSDSHFTIYGNEPDQYPEVPGFEDGADFQIQLSSLQEGIDLCLFAAARESTRYAINGVLWELKDKKLTLVATDGRRLARTTVPLEAPASKTISADRIIVPAKTMSIIEKIGSAKDEKVLCRLVDNKIILQCGHVVVSSNLVDGNFPKYEDIIPSGYDKKVMISTDATLSAVKRAALLITEESKGIKIALSKNSIVFTSRAPETGDAQIDMTVEYNGPPIEIGFNPQFLVDVLRVVKEDQVELSLGESDRPGLVKIGTNFLYLVMPVNLG